jgi:N-methylhydantoinase A/oxoprolinase/acetone carboxylase beta subunit
LTKYRVAIDIGGTFTDLVALNERSGGMLNIKVPSTSREPKCVLHDVLNALVSLEAAKKDYGVVIDPVTMKIDWKSTQLFRAKQKA